MHDWYVRYDHTELGFVKRTIKRVKYYERKKLCHVAGVFNFRQNKNPKRLYRISTGNGVKQIFGYFRRSLNEYSDKLIWI